MSRIIRDVSKDIKCKVKEADRDIRKAIERKQEYLNLANCYYDFSMEKLEEINDLHKEVVSLIDSYRKEKGEPPSTMLEMWDWEHKSIMEDIEEIKLLQSFYKTL